MSTNSEKQTEMDAKGSDVGSGLAGHPENGKVAVIVKLGYMLVLNCFIEMMGCTNLNELGLVDSSNTKNSLDGRDQGATVLISKIFVDWASYAIEGLLTVAGRENQ